MTILESNWQHWIRNGNFSLQKMTYAFLVRNDNFSIEMTLLGRNGNFTYKISTVWSKWLFSLKITKNYIIFKIKFLYNLSSKISRYPIWIFLLLRLSNFEIDQKLPNFSKFEFLGLGVNLFCNGGVKWTNFLVRHCYGRLVEPESFDVTEQIGPLKIIQNYP